MAVAVIPFMAVFGTFYFLRKKKNRKAALFCKAAATCMPLLLLIRNCPGILWETADGGRISLSFMATLGALVFYMAADVLLECRFVWGAVCFGTGHILMAAGILLGGELAYGSSRPGDVLPGLAGTAACFVLSLALAWIFLKKYFFRLGKLAVPAVLYVAVLSLMCAFAVTAGAVRGWPDGIPAAAGGICFLISDILLGINRLGRKRSRARGAAVLILYYLSVYFMALRFLV